MTWPSIEDQIKSDYGLFVGFIMLHPKWSVAIALSGGWLARYLGFPWIF